MTIMFYLFGMLEIMIFEQQTTLAENCWPNRQRLYLMLYKSSYLLFVLFCVQAFLFKVASVNVLITNMNKWIGPTTTTATTANNNNNNNNMTALYLITYLIPIISFWLENWRKSRKEQQS